jgi:acyl phosphate:glycerol-3-phosphate acyltransferase
MTIEHATAVSLTSAYLLGSIPFGYLLVRIIHGDDVRQTGSGNIGATNVSRTSPVLGVATLLLDAIKGLAAVALVLSWIHGTRELAFAAALVAIIGHMFPVWLGFRGGKGVATGLGAFLFLTPKAVLISIVIFLALVAAFRWVALGSVVASASLPPLSWALGEANRVSVVTGGGIINRSQPLLWITFAAVLIVIKHHGNIRRMLAHAEPRFHLSSQ